MKKSELHQIIKEEINKVLNEGTKLIPKNRYILKDNEFNTERIVRFVGEFNKHGAKYYKFTDLKTNKSFNLNLDFEKDYTITPNN